LADLATGAALGARTGALGLATGAGAAALGASAAAGFTTAADFGEAVGFVVAPAATFTVTGLDVGGMAAGAGAEEAFFTGADAAAGADVGAGAVTTAAASSNQPGVHGASLADNWEA